MMMWIYPQKGYEPDDLHYETFGRTVLGENFYGDPNTALPSLTLKGDGDQAQVMMHFGHANGQGYCRATSTSILNYDEWQHLAVTFNGAEFRFYVNGVYLTSSIGTNCSSGQGLYPAENFYIGHPGGLAIHLKTLEITGGDDDEGYIWSNDNTFKNNAGWRTELIWSSGWGTLDNGKTLTLDNWVMSKSRRLTYWVCNRDQGGNIQGCLDADDNDDEPLYYSCANHERDTLDYWWDSLGEYTRTYYKGSNPCHSNKWGADLTYDRYANDFKGKLDEIALYNTDLSADTVEDLYLSSLRMAYLTFDEPPGQDTFQDATAYDVAATCSGAHCPDSGIPGRDNQALRFDGVDDYVEFPLPLDPDAQNFTAAAWFKVDTLDTGDQQRLLQQEDGSGTGRAWLSLLPDGQLRTYFGGSGLNSGADNTVTAGQWHHAALTWDGSTVTLYLDGVEVASATRSAETNDGNLLIGVDKDRNGDFFGGLIDEVVVQLRALDQAYIVKLMLEAPVLNLHLDEDLNTTTFADDTNYNNTATCTGNGCPGTGYKGQVREAPVFDGDDDTISADISNVGLDETDFSIALWVKPVEESGVEQRLIEMDHLKLYLLSDPIELYVSYNLEPGCSVENTLNGDELALNEWSHIVVTVNGEATDANGQYPIRVYVNGSEKDYSYQEPAICSLGTNPVLGGNLSGSLDEVAIYGDALRDDEVRALYDYQAAWYDQIQEHPVLIDADDPQVKLELDTDYLALEDIQLAITAVDTSTAVSLVQVTLTEPGGVSTTVNATRSDNHSSDAWFYYLTPSVPGQYTIDLVAYDVVSNTTASSRTFYVDSTPPAATLSPALIGVSLKTSPPAGEGSNVLTLYGQASDPVSPASGIVTNTIAIEVRDWQGGTVAGNLFATADGSSWQVDYPFANAPYGQYQVRVDLADQVGNVFSTTLGTINLDDLAPTADIVLAHDVISDVATILTGTVTDVPYPNQSKRLHLHFEESSGATQFVDGTRARAIATCVGDCPTAGQSGQYGDALAFDGSNDTLTVTTGIDIISDTFTAMAWFNLDDTAATYTLLAQESGASWLSVSSSGRLSSTLGGTDLTGVTSITPSQWHHAAVSFDGDTLRLYLDGKLEATITRTLAFNDGDFVIGADGGFGALLNGLLDELVVYDAALTADQLYDIANPLGTGITEAHIRFRHMKDTDDDENAGDWYPLTLALPDENFSTWSMTPPSDLEGLYKIDLKASDELSHTGFIPNVWQGNIDLLAPRLALTYTLINEQYARAECYAYDFNITNTNWLCPADSLQAIAESADWFTQTFTDTTKTTAYSTTLQTVAALSDTLTACDIFGHCATTTISNPTTLDDVIAIITPTETTVITGLFPIEVAGYARSDPRILTINLLVDGQSIYYENHKSGSVTETHFSTLWTPDRPGTHVLEAVLQPRYGSSLVDPVQVTVQINAPKLAIAKTLTPTGLSMGDPLTYTIVASNTGNLPAEGVRITDTLPAYLSGSEDLDQTITLPVGSAVSYTISAQVVSPTIYVANTAWVSHTWQRISASAYDFQCDRFEVFTAADSGPGSLRHAIDNTCGTSTITFADDFTITLQSELSIDNESITIDGSGRNIIIRRGGRALNIKAGSVVTLTHLTIERGKPGIENRGTLRVFDCTLRDNDARAIYHNSAQPLIVSDSTFDDNWSGYSGTPDGGGLYLTGGGVVTITNSYFYNNRAYRYGGSIYNNNSQLVLVNSEINSSVAKTGGGLYLRSGSATTISGSHFHNNRASVYNGGGIRNDGVLTVTNSTFTSNRGNGAAIFNNGTAATIIHATFSGNRSASGGVTDIVHISGQPLLLANSILANRVVGKNCHAGAGAGLVVVNTLIEDGTCSPTFSGDPGLAALGDYGGETRTMPLSLGSPARDVADPAYCSATDQRGLARPVPVGAACDLGAFESQFHLLSTGSDQSTPLAMTFGQPLSVTMSRNGTSEPLGSPGINFSAPATGPSLSVTDFSDTLDAQGHYSTSVTANAIPGSYLVTATVPGINQSVTFSLTNLFVDLAITKTVTPAIVLQNQPLTYTMAFSNVGNINSGPVTIEDLVPAAFVPQGITVTVDAGVQITQTTGITYQWTIDDLAPGQGGAITLTGLVASDAILAQSIVNQADISSAHTEAETANNQATATRLVACYPVSRLYVDADASGTASGISWTDAYTTVQDGLTAARSCGHAQEIWVAEGIYYTDEGAGQTADNRGLSFKLVNGVEMYGGFAGGETELSERSYTANLTILSGDLQQDDITDANGVLTDTTQLSGTNSYYVVWADSVDDNTVLDGFTITAGQADSGRDGAGLRAISGSPTLRNLVFSGNFAGDNGGGMYCRSGAPSLTNVTFVGNRADDGGGVNMAACHATFDRVVFSGNQAGTNTGRGGGIFLNAYSGVGTVLTITNGVFSGNDATDGQDQGGAIYNQNSRVTLVNVSFDGNWADDGGAAIASSGTAVFPATIVLTNTIIWNNAGSAQISRDSDTSIYIGHSLIQSGCPGGAVCTDISTSDPLFAAATDPANAPAQGGDLRLLPASPAIDGGTNTGAPATDMRGLARPFNGTVDLGAYETQGFTLAYSGGSDQFAVIGNTFLNPLAVTITANADDAVGPGSVVTFTAPTSGASLSDDVILVQTDAAGVAELTAVANDVTGDYIVTAMAEGVSGSATFVLTNTQAVLTLDKQVSPVEAVPGEIVTYTLTISNGGLAPVSGLVITDFISIDLTVQQVISSGDMAITRTASTPTAETFALGSLPAGGSGIITLTAQLTIPLSSGPLWNTAVITGPTLPSSSTQQASAELTVLNVGPVLATETFTTSEGSANGTVIGTVTVTDTNADTLAYSISSGNQDNAFAINAGTGELLVNDKTALDYETQTQHTLTIVVDDGVLTASTTITVNLTNADTDLWLNKSVSTDLLSDFNPWDNYTPTTEYLATPGGILTYTLSFTNTGADKATGIVITDVLPAEVTLISYTFSLDNGGAVTQTGTSPLQWAVSDLETDENGVITLTGQVSNSLGLITFTNTAAITSTIPDLAPGDNQSQVAVAGCAHEIVVTNTAKTGAGSLQRALYDVCEGGRITFASSMTIAPFGANDEAPYYTIGKGLTLDGTGHDVVIDGTVTPEASDDTLFEFYDTTAPVVLTHITISNTAFMYFARTIVTLDHFTMTNSTTMQFSHATVTITGSTLMNNDGLAMSEASYIDVQDSHLTLINSSVISNSGSGAAVGLSDGSTAEIINTTIAHNVFDDGAGLRVDDSVVTVTHSTIAGNGGSDDSAGNGNISAIPGNSSVILDHSIVAGGVNSNTIGAQDCYQGENDAIVDAGYNLLGSNCAISTSTTSRVDSSRVFSDVLLPLGDYGGDTATFALPPTSPALDGGATGTCPASTDQRGITRPQGTACDVGAFEGRGYTFTRNGSLTQTTSVNTQFAAPLQVTLAIAESGVPIDGHVVTFTAPVAGASLSTPTITATTNAGGVVSTTVFANGASGSYSVTATLGGSLPPITFTLTNVIPEADLQISKSVTPTTIVPGQAVTYTLSFVNDGSTTATGVVITDIVPSEINLTGFENLSGLGITATGSVSYVWQVEDLAYGEGGVILVTGVVSDPLAAGVFTNTAIITGTALEGDPDNNQAEVSLTMPAFAPVLAQVPPQSITETELLTITFVATDTNGDELNFELTEGYGDMYITPDGFFTWQAPAREEDGLYFATVVVSDSGSLSDSMTIPITVVTVNLAPIISPTLTDQTVAEGEMVSFMVAVEDNDLPEQTLTVSLSDAPAGATLDANGLFTWQTTEADGPSAHTPTFYVSDGVLTTSQTIAITVTEQNQPPVMAPLSDHTVVEGDTISFTVVVTDTDLPTQPLTYTLLNAPAGATLDGSGNFDWPTTENDDGVYAVTVNVSDGLITASQTIALTVTEIAAAPVLAPLNDQTINEGELITFTAMATDTDLPTQTLTFSLAEAPYGAVISSSGGLFTWQTDDADGGGVYTVTVVVSDEVLTDSQTIFITVNDIDVAPTFVATLTGQTINEGYTLSINAIASDPDIPAQPLNYSLSNAPAGMTITDTGRVLWPTGEADGPGLYNISIHVDDGVATTIQTVAITVTEINQSPLLAPLNDLTVVEGTSISFTAATTDTDVPAQTLTYTLETNTPASIDSGGVFSWTTTEADGGTVYPIIINVTDGVVTASQSIAITVTEINDIPLLAHIDDITASEISRVSFTAIATDTDIPLQQLTYSLSNAPVSATIGSHSGDFAWLTTRDDGPGVYNATVHVSDGLLTTTQTIAITVTEQNDAPVITPLPTQFIIETFEITLTIEAVDDPDQFLTFSLKDAPPGADINDDGDFSWLTTEGDGPGVYTMTVLASDYMLTGTQVLTIYVAVHIPVITNLTLVAVPDEMLANGLDEATLTLTATDASGNGDLFAGYVVTFAWTLSYYPDPVTVTLDANGVATTTFTAGHRVGTAIITATVRDGESEKRANTQITLFASALAGRITAEFGRIITYTFVVSNADAINIQEHMVMSGSVPAYTELLSVGNGISVTTGGDYGWGYVEASGFDLAPSEAYTLTWVVRPLRWVGDIDTQAHAASQTARLRLALLNRVYRVLLILVYKQFSP